MLFLVRIHAFILIQVKIQYFSDLHLEFGTIEPVSDGADVIIAAGDIGVGLDGISWLTRFDQPVIYVLGNHEYWGQDYTGFIDQVWQESSGSNVHFLENESVEIDGVRFVGCTGLSGKLGSRVGFCDLALYEPEGHMPARSDGWLDRCSE